MKYRFIGDFPSGHKEQQVVEWGGEEFLYRVDVPSKRKLDSLDLPEGVFIYPTDKYLYMGGEPGSNAQALMMNLYRLFRQNKLFFVRAWRCRNEIVEATSEFEAWAATAKGFSTDFVQLVINSPKNQRNSPSYRITYRMGLDIGRHYIWKNRKLAKAILELYSCPDLMTDASEELSKFIVRRVARMV
ncbi:MAG: hypothetical protein WAP74_04115 [Patescibacteria group bacterium]